MDISALWAVGMLLAAFAGGAFGAALGALPAFIFTGFLVIAGETANVVGQAVVQMTGMAAADLPILGITGSIGFGPVFGPHISFAGGAAAAAYSAKVGHMDTGFPYYDAKNIAFAQGPKPDVLVVGGLFGILGYWITTISSGISLPWDPIAIGVVLSALAHRLIFKFPLIGEAKKGLLNISPFEEDEKRVIGEAATAEGDGDTRLLVEPWLPHQYKWADVTILGLVVGVLAAFTTYKTGSIFLPFGISAASLLFLNCGVSNIPVTNHISLLGSTAPLAATTGDITSASLIVVLLIGGLFGMISANFGELTERIFYMHGDTHWDPPASAIVITTLIVVILAAIGVFPDTSWVPTPF